MKKLGLFLTALVVAFVFAGQGAEAGYRKKMDRRVKAVSIVAPAAATVGFLALNDWKWKWRHTAVRSHGLNSAGAYALTSVGCAAASPIVATMLTGRELTSREAHVMVGSCFLPIVGGYIVNAMYDANPQWEGRRRR